MDSTCEHELFLHKDFCFVFVSTWNNWNIQNILSWVILNITHLTSVWDNLRFLLIQNIFKHHILFGNALPFEFQNLISTFVPKNNYILGWFSHQNIRYNDCWEKVNVSVNLYVYFEGRINCFSFRKGSTNSSNIEGAILAHDEVKLKTNINWLRKIEYF